jgi:hypothetical protein
LVVEELVEHQHPQEQVQQILEAEVVAVAIQLQVFLVVQAVAES